MNILVVYDSDLIPTSCLYIDSVLRMTKCNPIGLAFIGWHVIAGQVNVFLFGFAIFRIIVLNHEIVWGMNMISYTCKFAKSISGQIYTL